MLIFYNCSYKSFSSIQLKVKGKFQDGMHPLRMQIWCLERFIFILSLNLQSENKNFTHSLVSVVICYGTCHSNVWIVCIVIYCISFFECKNWIIFQNYYWKEGIEWNEIYATLIILFGSLVVLFDRNRMKLIKSRRRLKIVKTVMCISVSMLNLKSMFR